MSNKLRIVLKISGESLGRRCDGSWDRTLLDLLADEILSISKPERIQLAIVIGGGNVIRGSELKRQVNLNDSAVPDYCGMLATVINGMILQDVLEHVNVQTRLMTAVEMKDYGEPFIRRKAIRHLEKGRVVIFAGGTGNPGCSTDSAAVLRAFEIGASLVLKGTKVDGIYDRDPFDKHSKETAKRFSYISYGDFLSRDLKIIDATAVADARSKNLPIRVFNIFDRVALWAVICDDQGSYSEVGPPHMPKNIAMGD